MPFPTPGSDAANQARWAALTPAQRAAEQAQQDRNAAEFDRQVRASQRVGRWVGRGVRGVAAVGAGTGVASMMGYGAPSAVAANAANAAPTTGIGLTTGGATMPTFGAPAGIGLTTGGGSAASGIGTTAGYGSLFGGNGAFLGPTGAATAGTSTGGTMAPIVLGGGKAGASRLASMFFTSPLASTVAQGLFGIGAQRSQNKAADQARRDTLAANAAALQLQREQLEEEIRSADLDREDARALNAAINELKKRELDAAEEVRAFDREQALYLRSRNEAEDRRIEAQEQRREPYRQAGQAALGRLMSMWGM